MPLIVFSLSFAEPPKLIVFISIDQMRPDYFERYGSYFTGGFKRLYDEGIVYTNADLNFAASETGPGHATLSTGCFPWKNGILANDWVDRATLKTIYCVEDSNAKPVDGLGGGFSPRNLAVTAIGDWLKEKSPASKVVSVSTKDRAAILMGGKHPDLVFWYDKTYTQWHGKSTSVMVTSDYYMKKLPQWVKQFNTLNWAEQQVPDIWTKSLPESLYQKIGPDDFPAEGEWNGKRTFPHEFTAGKKAEQISGSPYGDKMMIDFAMNAVQNEKLGQRSVTDLLCISLSNCDYVGHAQGPDSHEMLDLLVKIDGYLGEFFSFLEKKVGKNKFIVALSADHAVCPLPEFNTQFKNIAGKRYLHSIDVKPKIDSLSAALKQKLNSADEVIMKNSFINYAAGAEAGWDSIQLETEIKTGLLSIEAFEDVYFRRELISRTSSDKLFIQKYRNSYFALRGEDFQTRTRENSIIYYRNTGTTHGSPYRYDTHVPLIFWRKGIKAQKISREVYTADIAPTFAKYAGFNFPAGIDGKPLLEILE